MELILHAADISKPLKNWSCAFLWTTKVVDEFWIQGDLERDKGVPISYLCDRYTTNLVKSQYEFISFIVSPIMEVISKFLPAFVKYLERLD